MTELYWQVAFLLGAAFFLGGVIACSLKRKFYYRSSTRTDVTPAAVAPAATEPKIEVAPRGQTDSDSERFGSALSGASVASSTSATEPESEPMPAKPAAPQTTSEETKLVFPPTVQKVEPSNPEPESVRAQSAPEPMPAPQLAAEEPALDLDPPPPAPQPDPVTALAPEPQRARVQDSAPPERDVSHLRSVRSEALRGQEASRPSGVIDDLKRIRGIGVLIERKLHSLGVTSYEQVANWTGADIERVSNILDFKGRIERENWIEQARILATGGQTEFSRRSDRGDA